MSRKTEQKLSDLAKWFVYNKSTITDVDKRSEFMEHAVMTMIIMFTHIIEDIQALERREKSEILLPSGIRFNKDVRS